MSHCTTPGCNCTGEGGGCTQTPECIELNRVARILIAEWTRVERKAPNPPLVATLVDLARVVIADRQAVRPHPPEKPPNRQRGCNLADLDPVPGKRRS